MMNQRAYPDASFKNYAIITYEPRTAEERLAALTAELNSIMDKLIWDIKRGGVF